MNNVYRIVTIAIVTWTTALVATGALAKPTTPDASNLKTQAQSYNSATNLNAYINKLRLKSNGTGDFYVAEAKAMSECWIFASNPSYANDNIRHFQHLKGDGYPYAQTMISMYERLNQRCQNFAPGMVLYQSSTDSLNHKIHSLYARAAAMGNVEAIAHNLIESASSGDIDNNTVLIRALGVIRTKNPAAIFELSELFGIGGPLKLTNNTYRDPKLSVTAWRFVACDLGLDCSASSALIQQQCLSAGPCETGDYRDNIRQSELTPSQFTETVKIENQLLEAIHNGNIAHFVTVATTKSIGFYLVPDCTQQPEIAPNGYSVPNGRSVSPLKSLCGNSDGQTTINASEPPYNTAPALQGIGIDSDVSVREGGDSQARGRYVSQHGLESLPMGSVFTITYQDKTSESVLVVNPLWTLSSVPIPGSQVSSDGNPVGTVTVGASIQVVDGWTCTWDGKNWSCHHETEQK